MGRKRNSKRIISLSFHEILYWYIFITYKISNEFAISRDFFLLFQFGDSQSVHSYRTVENPDSQSMAAIDDGVSLRSLPLTQHSSHGLHSQHSAGTQHLNPPRSMSPVSSMSGDELSHGGRRSQRRRPLLDKQVHLINYY